MVTVRPTILFLVFAAFVVGCGSERQVSKDNLAKMAGGSVKPVTSIKGKVLIDGTPTAGVNIYLYGTDGATVVTQTRTNADGTYCWSTYEQCDGLTAGDYKLTFKHIPQQKQNDRDQKEDDQLKGRYANPAKTEFKLSVASDGKAQENVDYELKSK